MNISFRVDAGAAKIGSGHLVRSIALAECLYERGHQVSFVSRQIDKTAEQILSSYTFPVRYLPADSGIEEEVQALRGSEFIVVDSYEVDEERLRRLGAQSPIALITDIEHSCILPVQLLVNPQLGAKCLGYKLPSKARYLAGPEFYIFRKQFLVSRGESSERAGSAYDTLVFFGGFDEYNCTNAVLKALSGQQCKIKALLGPSYPEDWEGLLRSAYPEVVIIGYQEDMLSELRSARVLISSPSVVCCEAALLGIPAICIQTAGNQALTAGGLSAAGAIHLLGNHRQADFGSLPKVLSSVLEDEEVFARMSAAGQSLFDGQGVQRIADALESSV